MRKHHPFAGLLLIAAAIAVILSPQCGLLGHAVARGLHLLIGSTGVVLLTTILFLCGTVCLVPSGAVSRTVRELVKYVRRRPLPNRRAASHERPAPVPVREKAKVLPLRPQNDEVRAGLKFLGYAGTEIDEVLTQIDRTRGTEQQIRDALKILKRAS